MTWMYNIYLTHSLQHLQCLNIHNKCCNTFHQTHTSRTCWITYRGRIAGSKQFLIDDATLSSNFCCHQQWLRENIWMPYLTHCLLDIFICILLILGKIKYFLVRLSIHLRVMNVSFELAVPSNGHFWNIILHDFCSKLNVVHNFFLLDVLSFISFCNTTG